MKTTKFKSGFSGVNFLRAAYESFKEEASIFEKQIKVYPDRQSSIRGQKYLYKVQEILQELEKLISKAEKQLKF